MVDLNFKLVVAGVAAIVVGSLAYLGFCGELSLPPKPPPPPANTIARASDILSETSGTSAAWRTYLETDAKHAGLRAPDPEVLARVFEFHADAKARSLSPGDSIKTAGLKLSVEIATDDDAKKSLVLVIENLGQIDLAYQIVTRPSVTAAACHGREILLHDAMVIAGRRRVRRSECSYRDDMELHIDRVETVELPPLSAWYVSRVPPSAVNLDTRLTKGHRPFSGSVACNVMMSQAIRGGLEKGKIKWRDLVDFYARHRCDTYQFPQGYRAFKTDNERPLPAM